jgi:hypothetical protein
MAIDIDSLTDYSWDDIAIAAKHAMVSAAVGGGTLRINGREIGRITIQDAKTLYEMAVEQSEAETVDETGDGIALVQFVDPL